MPSRRSASSHSRWGGWSPEDRVVFQVRALAMVPEAEPLLNAYLRVIALAAQRLVSSTDERPVLRDTDLTETLDISADAIQRLSQLVLAEDWMFGGGSSTEDGPWERYIDELIVPVRGVQSIDDYLQAEAQRFWLRSVQRPSAPAPKPVQPDHGERAAPFLLASELHPALGTKATALLADGHWDEAIRAAALALRDHLRERSGRYELDGAQLVGAALGGPAPAIRIADVSGNDGKREQDGWRMLAEGCVAVLRNPVAHRNVYSDRVSAFEALATMSLVARQIDGAQPHVP